MVQRIEATPAKSIRRRVAEKVAEKLRTQILSGAYGPGEKLPPERDLAKDLGVNRASVREALKALAQLGLIRSRQGDGTRVLDFMKTAGLEVISHLIPIAAIANDQGPLGTGARALLGDIIEFRAIFAREVAGLAATRRTEEDLKALEAVAAQAAFPGLTPEQLVRLDFDFYAVLTRASANRVMVFLINTVGAAVEKYSSLFASLVTRDSVHRHHREIIEAVRKGNAAAATRAAEEHMRPPANWLQSPGGDSAAAPAGKPPRPTLDGVRSSAKR
jgi:GntR family transcriptional repressor for pyruvate dehydrogenase complex